MTRMRPLDMAKNRLGDTIELTDSSDSTRRRPRPSQASTAARKDDPIIIITSGSEDDQTPVIRPTQRRKGPPPPADAEVISIPDSDEDLGASEAASRTPIVSITVASTSQVNPPPPSPQRAPAASSAAPQPAAAPAPTDTPAVIPESTSTSTRLPEQPPSRSQDTQEEDELLSEHGASSSYAPPPDDLDDAFGNMNFGTAGDDADRNGTWDEWDNLDVGPSLATLPAAISSGPAGAGASAGASTSVPERVETGSVPDDLFNSFVNMDQLGEGEDQTRSEDALPGGGDVVEERTVEDGVADFLGASTREGSGGKDRPNADADRDAHMQRLEEGEVDPREAPPRSKRPPGTPESGEILSQVSSEQAPRESRPPPSVVSPPQVASQPARIAPADTVARLSPSASASPRSTTSGTSASQLLERTSSLVMPDISLYKGVRFKRPLPDARENPFFSRALIGAARSGRAPENVGESHEQREKEGEGPEGSASGDVSTPADVPSSVGEVQNQSEDADMQVDAAVSMPAPSGASDAAVVPTPPPLQQQPAEAPRVSVAQSTSFTAPVQAPTAESSTTANDHLPPSTQPTMSSVPATPPHPPAGTQPLVRTSSRPFIVPPRVPRPNAPMSLVEALNEVCREHLQARRGERELVRKKRSTDNNPGTSIVDTVLESFLMHGYSRTRCASQER